MGEASLCAYTGIMALQASQGQKGALGKMILWCDSVQQCIAVSVLQFHTKAFI